MGGDCGRTSSTLFYVRGWAAAAASVATLALGAGCTALLGLSDKTFDSGGAGGSGTTASASGAGGAGGGTCGAGEQCFAAPPGWIGPVVVHGGAAACSSTWSTTVVAAYRFVNQTPIGCHCVCAGQPVSCNTSLAFFADGMCTAPVSSYGPSSSCVSIPVTGISAEVTTVPMGGGCGIPTSQTTPSVLTTVPVMLCAPTTGGAPCGSGGTCSPDTPPGEAACVYAMGQNLACPSAFPISFILAAGYTDQSSCDFTACNQCKETAAPSCQASALLAQASCTKSFLDVGTTCTPLSGTTTYDSYLLSVVPIPASCAAPLPGGQTSYSVTQPAYTLCCTS
jgi:hypothetical protein